MAQESWKREQEAGCQPPDGPVLCAKNCGFFGSAATMNMCSKCYRDHVLQQTKEAARSSAAASAKQQLPKQFDSSHQYIPQGVDPMDVDGAAALSRATELPSAATKSGSVQGAGAGSKDAAECLRCPEEPAVDEMSLACASSLVSAHPPASESASEAPAARAATAAPASAPSSVSASASKSQPNRCACCKKRVGLTGFKCRCEKVFCSAHRYSDKHDCSFDYKAAARNAIAKANPVVRAEKINKI